MSDWPDQKIQKVSLWYINQCSMQHDSWRYTKLGAFHSEIESQISLADGELPIVSSYISEESWYSFTTRRIVGLYDSRRVDEFVLKVTEWDFSDLKGYGQETEIMVLSFPNNTEGRLEFESGYASMAPIYAQRFWHIKYPVLDVLKG